MTITPCHWVKDDDGNTIMIPGCWPRAHDPNADCTCTEWSEDSAREIIRGLRAHNIRLLHQCQTLRATIRHAGLSDPTAYNWQADMEAARRRRMHRLISGEDA